MNSEHQIWFIFQRDGLLVDKNAKGFGNISEELLLMLKPFFTCEQQYDQYDGYTIYYAALPNDYLLPADAETIPLRSALEHLDDDWYRLLSRAFFLVKWDRNHQFCGQCSKMLRKAFPQFEAVCNDCSLIFYPKISPCVIIRIQKDDQILMARGHHFPPGRYALIAGFVEGGENIEEAIRREVYEEVALKITNLKYFGSQAWPFPDSLMLGFTADYYDGELIINKNELEHAGWYDANHLPGQPSTSISIAAQMIRDFVQNSKR